MKIRLILSIDCDNEQTATMVQDQYLPNLNDLLHADGITAVKAEWVADSRLWAESSPDPRTV